MAIAFVLISIQSKHKKKIYEKLSKVEGISELCALTGKHYDLIAKIDTNNFESVVDIIKNKIRTIEGITDTKTLTGIKF